MKTLWKFFAAVVVALGVTAALVELLDDGRIIVTTLWQIGPIGRTIVIVAFVLMCAALEELTRKR